MLRLIFTDEAGTEYTFAQGPEPAEAMTPRTQALAIALLTTALNELTGEPTAPVSDPNPEPDPPTPRTGLRFANEQATPEG